MAIGDNFNPKTLKQLAADSANKANSSSSTPSVITSDVSRIEFHSDQVYKWSAKMSVKVENKCSKVAQRQILHIHKSVSELSEKYEGIRIKDIKKDSVQKKWSYKRFKHKKKMGFQCQLSFSVHSTEKTAIRNMTKDILSHVRGLMEVFADDHYRLWDSENDIENGIEHENVPSQGNVNGITSDEMNNKTGDSVDECIKFESKEPQPNITSEAGNIHYEDKSKKTHYSCFNCFNTGRKEDKGGCSAIFGVFAKCLPCLFKKA